MLKRTNILFRLIVRIKSMSIYFYTCFGPQNRLLIDDSAVVLNAFFNTVGGKIIIGKNVFFGQNVSILTGTHDYNQFNEQRKIFFPHEGRDILIDEGVWIASNATVIGPVHIGSHSVVAAGSVVIDDIPSYTIYGGNPARFIKKINEPF